MSRIGISGGGHQLNDAQKTAHGEAVADALLTFCTCTAVARTPTPMSSHSLQASREHLPFSSILDAFELQGQ